MDKLKKGWLGVVAIGTLTSLFLSYVLIGMIFKYGSGSNEEIVNVLLHPSYIYNYVINDENLIKIVPFIPILMIAVILYMLRKNFLDLKYDDASDFGVKGTARWGTIDSVTNGKILARSNISFSRKNFKKGLEMQEGIIVGKAPKQDRALIIHDDTNLDNKNVFISGSSGSGKGQSHVITNIVNNRTENIIVIDPKGENYAYTHQLKRDQGYKVYNIDFANFSESRYNPLDYVTNDEDATKISEIIARNSADDVKMDFFTERAQALLASLISYVKSEYPKQHANMKKVIEVFNKYISDPEDTEKWLENMDDNNPAKGLLVSVLGDLGSPNTRSSVTSSFQSLISIFQRQRVSKMTEVSDFMFDDFENEKSILYVKIAVPTNPFKALTSVFFVQMIDRFFDLGDRDPLGKLKIPVHFILDEFPNIGRITGYQETLALCRGYRMYMHTIIQDISQLEQRNMYGKETTRSIVSNHSTKLILKVGEPETAEYWSKWFGETTIKYKSESSNYGKQGKSTNHSDVYDRKKLLPENELMKMDENEAYLLMIGCHPLKIEKSWQFMLYPNLLSDANRELNYNNVRSKIGFTNPIHVEKNANKNIKPSVFEDYQTKKEAMILEDRANETMNSIIEESELEESDIEEINETESVENKVAASSMDEVEALIDDQIMKGDDLLNLNTDDLLNDLES